MKTEVLQSQKFDDKKRAMQYAADLKKDKEKYNNITVSSKRNIWGWYTVSYFEWMEV